MLRMWDGGSPLHSLGHMIELDNDEDILSHLVIVEGLTEGATSVLSAHFRDLHFGVRPEDQSQYSSITIQLTDLDESLTWIKTNLSGRYRKLAVLTWIEANLSWSNIAFLPTFLAVLVQHGVEHQVSFASPP